MKRYVKEFANDLLSKAHNIETKERINKVVKMYERGFITPFDAVRTLVDIVVDEM